MVSGAYANEKEIVEIKTEVSETSDVVDATEVVETTEEEAN
jgi:hypothetical protein